jgi:hypothetical protein
MEMGQSDDLVPLVAHYRGIVGIGARPCRAVPDHALMPRVVPE